MARSTRQALLDRAASYGDRIIGLADLLAILGSAQNPDGSMYSLPVSTSAPAATDVLAGRVSLSASTAATTIITVPAGRTWSGQLWASASCEVTAAAAVAGRATAMLSVAGAGATPTAGVYLVVDARSGANAATGTAGSGAANFGSVALVIVAPAGNAVTVQVASTNAGSSSLVEAGASGMLVA